KSVNRRVIAAASIIPLSAAGAGWWWTTRAPPPVEWQGYAEADFIKAGPTQQGLLMSLFVARGSRVAAGAPRVGQDATARRAARGPRYDEDDTADRAARDQTERQLRQAEEQLANLQAAGKPTEIQQAEANLADTTAARDKIESDLRRNETLVKTFAAPQQLVDQQRADLRSANARVQALEAAVAQLRAPMGREGEI